MGFPVLDIILRLLHITTGVFWAGALMYLAAFILPAVDALGPDGGKFMQQLARTNRLPMVMNIVASVNVASGLIMLWQRIAMFGGDFLATTYGSVLTFGAAAALFAFVIGVAVNRPAVTRMGVLGRTIAESGAAPTQEHVAELTTLRKRLGDGTRMIAVLLAVTVIAMSVFRYL